MMTVEAKMHALFDLYFIIILEKQISYVNCIQIKVVATWVSTFWWRTTCLLFLNDLIFIRCGGALNYRDALYSCTEFDIIYIFCSLAEYVCAIIIPIPL